jgi:hypothetical protein
MTALFSEVPVGESFRFNWRVYRKEALSMATDEEQLGNIFMGDTVVQVADGVALFHGPRLPEPHWTEYLSPAPGQRG